MVRCSKKIRSQLNKLNITKMQNYLFEKKVNFKNLKEDVS